MECPKSSGIQRLLRGELNARRTAQVLDHVRECDACRLRLETVSDLHPTATPEPGAPRYQRYSVDEVMASKSAPHPGRRRGALALVMVVLLTWVGLVSKSRDKPSPADQECQEAVAAGQPWPVYPKGEGRRPRQFRVVLPEGTDAFTIRISVAGQSVYDRRWQGGERGAELYPTQGAQGGDMFAAVGGIVPFPSQGELPLEHGQDYEYRILLDTGVTAGPVPFRIVE